MSFAICRINKCSSSHDIAGLQIHDRRERKHSNSNPDIDFSKSKDNYSLCNSAEGISFNAFIDKQIAERYTGKKAIRKDAVRMVQVLFTSDKEFFDKISEEEQRQFFKDCYKWAADRWGENNIISADVHLDEVTPHMHLNFVPLTPDGRLSAKDLVGNGSKALQQMQDDFYKKVGKPHGLDRGIRTDLVNGERARKNQTVAEYKESTNYYEQKKEKLISEVQELEDKVNSYKEILNTEPLEDMAGVPVPSAAKLLIRKENKDKLLYAPDDAEKLKETAKALAVETAQLEKDKAEYDRKEKERFKAYGEENTISIWIKNADSYKAEAAEAERKAKEAEIRAAAVKEEADQYAAQIQEFYAERFPYIQSLKEETDKLKEEIVTVTRTKEKEYQDMLNATDNFFNDLRRDMKEDAEKIDRLEKELSDMKPMKDQNAQLTEQVRTLENEVKEKDGIIVQLNRKIEKLIEDNDFLNKLYRTACDVGRYVCDKLRLRVDFDKALDKRLDGYRLSHIFGDDRDRGAR